MRKFLLYIACICPLVGAYAQRAVSGQVVDETGEAVPFANVVLLTAADSALVTGGVTDETGAFRLETDAAGQALLKVSFVGYADLWMPVAAGEADAALGRLTLASGGIALEGVTVQAQRPLIRREAGNIVTTIENSSLSMIGTADDLMRYVPGVIQMGNSLTVAGKGAPTIYIDGRKLRDISELSRYSSNDIKTVKLILNPGAEYDADTRAVIDIRTNRRNREGFYALAYGRLDQRRHLLNQEMLNLSYSKGKFDWFLSYNHGYFRMETETEQSQRKAARDTLTLQTDRSEDIERENYQTLSNSFNLAINERHSVGVRYDYMLNKHHWETGDSPFDLSVNGNDLPTTWTRDFSDNRNHRHYVNAYYRGNWRDRLTWQLEADYLLLNQKNNSMVDETTDAALVHTDQGRDRDNRLAAAKLVMGYDWGEAGSLSWGAEYSYVENSGTSSVDDGATNVSYSAFENLEDKYAAFLSYRLQRKRFALTAGLRYENVWARAKSDGLRLVDKHYSELYPTVALFYTPADDAELGLNFSKRVSRPSFGQLSNERIYYSRYYWYYGNPVLDPEVIYEVELDASYKFLTFRLGYEHTTDYIVSDFMIDPTDATVTIEQVVNYPKFRQLSATLTGEKSFGPWRAVLNASVYKPFFKVEGADGGTFDYDTPYVNLSLNNSFTLPAGFVFRLDGYFYSGGSRGNVNYEPRGSLDASLSKSFLRKTLVLTLRGSDLFQWMNNDTRQEMNGLVIKRYTRGDSRSVSLTLTWRFNTQKKQYQGTGAGGDDLYRF